MQIIRKTYLISWSKYEKKITFILLSNVTILHVCQLAMIGNAVLKTGDMDTNYKTEVRVCLQWLSYWQKKTKKW